MTPAVDVERGLPADADEQTVLTGRTINGLAWTVARRYGGGLFKVEPRNLELAMVPADILSQT